MNLTIEPNERITYAVRYEDEHLLVVDKKARLATVPGKAHVSDTLLNGLFAQYGAKLQNVGKTREFGMCSRSVGSWQSR